MPATDRETIEDLARLMARAMDRRTISDLDDLMTDDVEIVYGFGRWQGRALHQRIFEATLPLCFVSTQHLLANAIVQVEADTGRAEYAVHATHLIQHGGPTARVGLTYRQELVRTSSGWRIAQHEASSLWLDDPSDIMPHCLGRMAAAVDLILAKKVPT